MGEYAEYRGEQIKIGTCEDMYYLRADQAHLVRALRGNVNPITQADNIRFRFPFPNEDNCKPGCFEDPFRAEGFYDVPIPEGVKHTTTQFVSSRGYLLSSDCPEMMMAKLGKNMFARNGNIGRVRLVQQRVWEGKLVLVMECGGCGAKYRLPTLEDAQPVIDSLKKQFDEKESTHGGHYYRLMAERIVAGYAQPFPWLQALPRQRVQGEPINQTA